MGEATRQEAAASAAPPAASVVICTYNRPAMFEAALRSCLRDATRAGLNFEIVVADNSIEGHAAAIVARVAAASAAVRVARVSPPNISLARNAGLRAAAAPLVAFMDDDLELEPGWLDALVDVLAATGADAAVGPVRPRFEGGSPPPWDKAGARFTRVLAQPSGSAIGIAARERPAGFAISTASSIWRAATCFTDAQPFAPDLGVCGGEDLDLFLRLDRRGRRVVWCAEAGVRETIPRGRTTLGYQRLRALSGAQVFAAATLRNVDAPLATALGLALRGAAQVALFAPATLALSAMARIGRREALAAKAADCAFKALAGWGKLTWWRRVGLYHIEKPPAAAGSDAS
jgi:succinoglycan biosynthesis protein ExoM